MVRTKKKLFHKNKLHPQLFEKFLRRVKSRNEVIQASERNKSIAREWFEVAIDDIQLAELSLNSKHDASSVHHFQQAVEKLTMCYLILSEKIAPNQAKDHRFILQTLKTMIKDGHTATFFKLSKLFKKARGNTLNQSFAAEDSDVLINEDITKLSKKSEDTLRQLNSEEIKQVFSSMANVERELLSPHFVKAMEKRFKRKKFLKPLRKMISELFGTKISYSHVKRVRIEKKVKEYALGSLIIMELFLLSIMTYPHCNTSRYPSIKDSKITFKSYDQNLGIVKELESFIKSFNEVSDTIKKEYFDEEK